MNTYRLFALLATLIIAASCAAPDTTAEAISESAPPLEEEASSGGSSCTLTSTCYVGTSPGKCARSLSTGNPMCCTGCVDGAGYCRTGNQWASECGAFGGACAQCAPGRACSSVGTCVSNCQFPGMECAGGVYGNGPNGTCVCCTSCFDPDSGQCVNSGDLDCGSGGVMCATCSGNVPHCVNGSCTSCNDNNPCTVDSYSVGQCYHAPAPGSTSCGTNAWCYQGWGTCCAGCNNMLADGTYECVSSCVGGKTCVGGFCS